MFHTNGHFKKTKLDCNLFYSLTSCSDWKSGNPEIARHHYDGSYHGYDMLQTNVTTLLPLQWCEFDGQCIKHCGQYTG